MLWLTKTLNLIFGYRWSVRFCEGGDEPRYLLHGDSPMQLLFHIGRMWEDKELREPWRIYLRFNKNGRSRELHRQDFEKELSSQSGDVGRWVHSIDPGFRMSHAHVAFVEAGSRRELPLGPRHTFVAGSKGEKARSDLMDGVARARDTAPKAVQSLDDLEDAIFNHRVPARIDHQLEGADEADRSEIADGGAVGAVESGGAGVLSIEQQPRFREYVARQDVLSYRCEHEVRVGTVLPSSGVWYYDVPAEYGLRGRRYTVVNGRTVLVDPGTHTVVQVIE